MSKLTRDLRMKMDKELNAVLEKKLLPIAEEMCEDLWIEGIGGDEKTLPWLIKAYRMGFEAGSAESGPKESGGVEVMEDRQDKE